MITEKNHLQTGKNKHAKLVRNYPGMTLSEAKVVREIEAPPAT